MALFMGTAGDDVINGGSFADEIAGGDGADVINGGFGADKLYSAYPLTPFYTGSYVPPFAPPPLLDWGTERDRLSGGNGPDLISVGYGDDADGGTSTISGPDIPISQDLDQLYLSMMGAPSGVTIDFRQSLNLSIGGGTIINMEIVQILQGSPFGDTLYAGNATYHLYGMGGEDRLFGGENTRLMDGGDGDDVLDASLLSTSSYFPPVLVGGAGNDLFVGARSTNITIYGGDGDDVTRGSGLFFAGNGNDRLETKGNAIFFGEAGDDFVVPSEGASSSVAAYGGSGADTLIGMDFGDVLGSADEAPAAIPGFYTYSGNYGVPADDLALDHDVIDGRAGNDVIGGGYGDDLNGGAGYDRLRYTFGGQTSGVTFDANAIAEGKALTIGGGTIQGFEVLAYLRTTEFDDTITLAKQVNVDPGPYNGAPGDELVEVQAGGGNDVIIGADSSANVFGGAGDDRFVSGKAPDVFDGGTGTDTIDYSGYDAAVNVSLLIGSGAGGDRLISVENVLGSRFDDRLTGDSGANVLTGGAGADTLTGGAGIDTFRDTLAGHAGDTINDLQTGESIVFTDASLSSFTYTATATSLSYGGNTITLGGFSSVTFAASAADGGGVRLTLVASEASNQIFRAASDPLIANFNAASGWTNQNSAPRYAADVSGDGRADIVGFGAAGVLVSTNTNGGFAAPALALGNFGQQQGWTSDNLFHRTVADLTGDGRADVIGFGAAGTLVSTVRADGSFSEVIFGLDDFGQQQGWTSQDRFTRLVGDVNGDGKADIVGFGIFGTLVAIGNGDGTFKPVVTGLANFGVNQGWTSDDLYHRALGDVNGDGKADIIGFGESGTLVALSNGDGTFAEVQFALQGFGVSQSWRSNDQTPRFVADINGDDFADIVGFGSSGTVVALGNGDGSFQAPRADVADFGTAQGWTSDNAKPHALADVNGDSFLDIVGFGTAGVVAGYNLLGAL